MRRAIIDITPEVLTTCLGVIEDHGYAVISTLPVDPVRQPLCRFIVEGLDLPEAPAGSLPLVSFHFSQQLYGRQKIVRLVEVRLIYMITRAEAFAEGIVHG